MTDLDPGDLTNTVARAIADTRPRTWAVPDQPDDLTTVWDAEGKRHDYNPAVGLWDYDPDTGGGWTWEQLLGLWGPVGDREPVRAEREGWRP